MQEPEAHSGPPIFKAWLLFIIVASVGGFFAGAAAGALIGFILAALGRIEHLQFYGGVAGFVAGLPVSFFSFRWAVNSLIVPNVWPPSMTTPAAPVYGYGPYTPPAPYGPPPPQQQWPPPPSA